MLKKIYLVLWLVPLFARRPLQNQKLMVQNDLQPGSAAKVLLLKKVAELISNFNYKKSTSLTILFRARYTIATSNRLMRTIITA
jgi:hypothetical protein